MANIECWLGSFVIFVNFLGIKTNIAKKPYTFCYFSGGGGGGPETPAPIWVCACHVLYIACECNRI